MFTKKNEHRLRLRRIQHRTLSRRIGFTLIFSLLVLHCLHFSSPNAFENKPLESTCYDWRGNIIPCDFQGQYAELLLGKPIPDPRFVDNQDGTVTDSLTGLIWLKNTKRWIGKVLSWRLRV
jgi:hypothetical protein